MLIYRITNKLNGKAYIGQTIDLQTRLRQHRRPRRGRAASLIQQAIQLHGWEAFTLDVLAQAKTSEELNRLEVEWIARLHTMDRGVGYNLTEGGGSCRGVKRSDATRALMSTAAKKRVTDEYRVHMRAVHAGKAKSEEHRASLRAAACARPTARIIEFDGLALNVAEWARRLGITKEGLKFPLDKGMPVHEALTKPVGRRA